MTGGMAHGLTSRRRTVSRFRGLSLVRIQARLLASVLVLEVDGAQGARRRVSGSRVVGALDEGVQLEAGPL